jgi:hypothetical protein
MLVRIPISIRQGIPLLECSAIVRGDTLAGISGGGAHSPKISLRACDFPRARDGSSAAGARLNRPDLNTKPDERFPTRRFPAIVPQS